MIPLLSRVPNCPSNSAARSSAGSTPSFWQSFAIKMGPALLQLVARFKFKHHPKSSENWPHFFGRFVVVVGRDKDWSPV